jgi:hypothetical protein
MIDPEFAFLALVLAVPNSTATASTRGNKIDGFMQVEFKFPEGVPLSGSTSKRVSKFNQQNIWITALLNSDVAPSRTGYAHPVELIEQAALQAAMTVPTGQVNDFDKLGL